MQTKTEHQWRDHGTNYGSEYYCTLCKKWQIQRTSQGINYELGKFCEDFDLTRARYERKLETSSLYVVLLIHDNQYSYLQRDGRYGGFAGAHFYSRKSNATTAMNDSVKYRSHKAEELRVVQINVSEPR